MGRSTQVAPRVLVTVTGASTDSTLFFCRLQIFSNRSFWKESENIRESNIQKDNFLPLKKGMNKVSVKRNKNEQACGQLSQLQSCGLLLATWSVSHSEINIIIWRLRFLSCPLLQDIPPRQETVLLHEKDKQSLWDKNRQSFRIQLLKNRVLRNQRSQVSIPYEPISFALFYGKDCQLVHQ